MPENDNRNLGDEWMDWNGSNDQIIKQGKGLFTGFALAVILLSDLLLALLVYFISPRLDMFFPGLSWVAWILVAIYMLITAVWFAELLLTTYQEKNCFFFRSRPHGNFERLFLRAVSLAKYFGFTRDQVGHSFIKVSNSVSRATKKTGTKEKLLILLPRCLTKDELKKIMEFKKIYPVEVFTVSGGELARKKVKEIKPTAVIGVACERDLVAGIRDVGSKFSVIGIPNIRPHGPCKDTNVDMQELEKAIQFYVGQPKEQNTQNAEARSQEIE